MLMNSLLNGQIVSKYSVVSLYVTIPLNTEGTGKISYRALRSIIRDLGEDISDEDIQDMIDHFDTDHDGFISLKEFEDIMLGDDW